MRFVLIIVACLSASAALADETPDAQDIVNLLRTQRTDALDANVVAQALAAKLQRELKQLDVEQDAEQDSESLTMEHQK